MNPVVHRIPILNYHKIDQRFEWGLNTVKPVRFRQQMQLLKDGGFTPVNFHRVESGALPEKPIIITFDDGYESVYDSALPVLQELDFTAVVFIITDYMGEENTWDANIGGIRFQHLNAGQIRELATAGFEIASHGKTHRALTMMDPEAVKNELCDSKKYLEDLISGKVLSVAYPFGLYDANLVELAVQCGYKYGCSGMWNRAAEPSAMCLQRIPVYRTDSLKAFYRKLSNGFSNAIEMSKLRVISWPARLTPVYQKISIATKNFLQKKIRLVSFEESSGE